MGFTSRELRVYPFLFQFVQMFKEHFAEDADISETDRIWVQRLAPRHIRIVLYNQQMQVRRQNEVSTCMRLLLS